MLAMQQVQDVAIAIREENHCIAGDRFAIGQERDGLGFQVREDGVEIGDGDGAVLDAGDHSRIVTTGAGSEDDL